MRDAPPAVVVMGVCGCGKSSVGERLARELGAAFIEGDAFHPPANVARMAAGVPLTDADRQGWLETLAAQIASAGQESRSVVLACSALKRRYRDTLRSGAPDLHFVHLQGDRDMLAARMAARQGHYMPASLLDSQLATLEAPGTDERAITLDAGAPTESLVQAALAQIQGTSPMNDSVPSFTQVILETGPDGRARWHERRLLLSEGKPAARLSALMPSGGCQLRESPVGFRSEFHCTETPQWVFILKGTMEIGLQDGTSRVFHPGEHFYSADKLPAGASFDATRHGHWSRQVGDEPLVTLFVRG